ncbi:MAG: primosomal protein N', partial [Edaphobacter sp.]
MPLFCDVALPVPLDQTFTYAVNGVTPVVGARVLVPFSGQRLMGVVVRVHEDAPADGFEIKPVQQVLDDAALLPDELMKLAGWIASYYVAPLGEVLRGMLPLAAEVKRHFVYRIAEAGRRVLYEGAAKGSSRRSKLSPEEQNREYAVLNYLEGGEQAKMSALRSATSATKSLLDGMIRKKWLTREAVAEERDARRLEKLAVLVGGGAEGNSGSFDSASRDEAARGFAQDDSSNLKADGRDAGAGLRLPKLNENQLAVMAELAA